jgi:hypothetical protein
VFPVDRPVRIRPDVATRRDGVPRLHAGTLPDLGPPAPLTGAFADVGPTAVGWLRTPSLSGVAS